MSELSLSKKLFFWSFLAFGLLIVLEIGLRAVYYTTSNSDIAVVKALSSLDTVLGFRVGAKRLDMPHSVIEDLTANQAIISNSNNPTRAGEHDTILVTPNPDTRYVLRTNVSIVNYRLRSTVRPNWDLPTLSIVDEGALKPETRGWIEENAYFSYRYSTDENGYRTTVPMVRRDNKILVVGDSVGFGSGVSDAFTSSSLLQQIMAKRFQVINAAVGGYSGDEVVKAAKRASAAQDFDWLVYIACQNDFQSVDDVGRVFAQLGDLSGSFQGGVIVVSTTYMEFSNDDFVTTWPENRKQRTRDVVEKLASESENRGFVFLNWDAIVQAQVEVEATPHAIFALYVDHVHFSPRGNRLLAELLAREIDNAERSTADPHLRAETSGSVIVERTGAARSAQPPGAN